MKSKSTWPILILLPALAMLVLPCFAQDRETPEYRPALLVMDVQNVWMPMMAEEDRDSALPKINEVIALFRELGHPVIRVYHSHPERGPELDTEPFEFPASIAVTANDPRVVKDHASAFTGTELERILREDDRNTVVICGLSATGCALATYFGASNRDFMAVMVKDALLSGDASHTDAIEEIFRSMSIEGLRETIVGG